jgi:hypothetical protein
MALAVPPGCGRGSTISVRVSAPPASQTLAELRQALLSTGLGEEYLDPQFDFDYTEENCRKLEGRRGGVQYTPPLGWKKLGLQVTGWYGENQGETDRGFRGLT